ncbi:toxin glutamine deamidase domain-containing protein, partial [Micromonospora sp. NPDC049366]|uniref:toxin glutamine deamidase domain-containing protein n=1 Tax=Micromonospora sp. NPDC049366 TaxID=3364271 RepID=UPI0037883539
MLTEIQQELYPHRAPIARARHTTDDSWLNTGHVTDQIGHGLRWQPVRSWNDLEHHLTTAGPGSTALVLQQRPHDIGHALVLHHSTDTQHPLQWLEPQNPPGDRLIDHPDRATVHARLGTPLHAQAIILDPTGTAISIATHEPHPNEHTTNSQRAAPTQARRTTQSESTAQALIDLPLDHRYGAPHQHADNDPALTTTSDELKISLIFRHPHKSTLINTQTNERVEITSPYALVMRELIRTYNKGPRAAATCSSGSFYKAHRALKPPLWEPMPGWHTGIISQLRTKLGTINSDVEILPPTSTRPGYRLAGSETPPDDSLSFSGVRLDIYVDECRLTTTRDRQKATRSISLMSGHILRELIRANVKHPGKAVSAANIMAVCNAIDPTYEDSRLMSDVSELRRALSDIDADIQIPRAGFNLAEGRTYRLAFKPGESADGVVDAAPETSAAPHTQTHENTPSPQFQPTSPEMAEDARHPQPTSTAHPAPTDSAHPFQAETAEAPPVDVPMPDVALGEHRYDIDVTSAPGDAHVDRPGNTYHNDLPAFDASPSPPVSAEIAEDTNRPFFDWLEFQKTHGPLPIYPTQTEPTSTAHPALTDSAYPFQAETDDASPVDVPMPDV